jgi:hypothetical protein
LPLDGRPIAHPVTLPLKPSGFRNAMFHFQGNLVSPKVQEFLDAEGSEDWTYDLYRAIKSFFEKQLHIKEFIDSLPERI